MATAQPHVMGARSLNPVFSLRGPVVQCRYRYASQLTHLTCGQHLPPVPAVVLHDPILLPHPGLEETPHLDHELQVVLTRWSHRSDFMSRVASWQPSQIRDDTITTTTGAACINANVDVHDVVYLNLARYFNTIVKYARRLKYNSSRELHRTRSECDRSRLSRRAAFAATEWASPRRHRDTG
jgi:hypothetical protein